MTESRIIPRAARRRVTIDLPPSKSYTQRALIAASLARGESIIRAPSRSTDSAVMVAALRAFGVSLDDEGVLIRVRGLDGRIPPGDRTIDVGNAGTCMRFLTAFAALAPGTTTITGSPGMLRRPSRDLTMALTAAGVDVSDAGGFPPVTVRGGILPGGKIPLDPSISSQYLSALLLVSPYAGREVEISLTAEPSSASYVPMTLGTMQRFGVGAECRGPAYRVPNGAGYSGCEFAVEPDASAAAFFGAAAPITGCVVELPGLSRRTLQGDIRFFDILASMGGTVLERGGGFEISGGSLKGVRADMNAIPDSVPALAVAAAFAQSPTVIGNVAHLRHKESDRLSALGKELGKIGARAEVTADGMSISPGRLRGAEIETYDDHRIAMSFAVAGLAIDGMRIMNPGCVAKSFPEFWTEIEKFT